VRRQVQCNALKHLDSDFKSLIKYAIQKALKNGYKPLMLENLERRNKELTNRCEAVQW
jgi:hypothetical protein